ncbi:hypothetical protein CYMTET_39215 [Cymbomonas tetramitiformis]|uniref:Uncharacterized protein n=1 Tax=Cymbomonas tetramitiformis TaxID=36881 RepID=A0AAE0CBV5_9CHLO|nr:hypothetical protein CYMTET_39215 [Cymbomonas tetramitiformis]
MLNSQLSDVKCELTEVTAERDALGVANEKLMFEIAEKETENTTLFEDLTRWKKNARFVTEEHRILLAKVDPCELGSDCEGFSDCEEVVEELG